MEKKNFKTFGISLVIIVTLIVLSNTEIMGHVVCSPSEDYKTRFENCTENSNDLESEIVLLSTNLSACNTINKFLDKQIEFLSKENLELTKNLRNHQEEISELRQNFSEMQTNYNDLKEKYAELSKNTANNICCKMKIDNPNINYYEIQNNKVICLEAGTKALSC